MLVVVHVRVRRSRDVLHVPRRTVLALERVGVGRGPPELQVAIGPVHDVHHVGRPLRGRVRVRVVERDLRLAHLEPVLALVAVAGAGLHLVVRAPDDPPRRPRGRRRPVDLQRRVRAVPQRQVAEPIAARRAIPEGIGRHRPAQRRHRPQHAVDPHAPLLTQRLDALRARRAREVRLERAALDLQQRGLAVRQRRKHHHTQGRTTQFGRTLHRHVEHSFADAHARRPARPPEGRAHTPPRSRAVVNSLNPNSSVATRDATLSTGPQRRAAIRAPARNNRTPRIQSARRAATSWLIVLTPTAPSALAGPRTAPPVPGRHRPPRRDDAVDDRPRTLY